MFVCIYILIAIIQSDLYVLAIIIVLHIEDISPNFSNDESKLRAKSGCLKHIWPKDRAFHKQDRKLIQSGQKDISVCL